MLSTPWVPKNYFLIAESAKDIQAFLYHHADRACSTFSFCNFQTLASFVCSDRDVPIANVMCFPQTAKTQRKRQVRSRVCRVAESDVCGHCIRGAHPLVVAELVDGDSSLTWSPKCGRSDAFYFEVFSIFVAGVVTWIWLSMCRTGSELILPPLARDHVFVNTPNASPCFPGRLCGSDALHGLGRVQLWEPPHQHPGRCRWWWGVVFQSAEADGREVSKRKM